MKADSHINIRDRPTKGGHSEVCRQVNLLASHVALRPNDIDGLVRLCLLAYEKRDYKSCLRYINRVLEVSEHEEHTLASHTTASSLDMQYVHLKRAKCLVRKWLRYGDDSNLHHAIASYRISMRNKEIVQRYDSYFELSSIMLKMGNIQKSLDIRKNLLKNLDIQKMFF